MAKILIVDDDAVIRITFTDILTLDGHEAVSAENGLEAIDVLKTQSFDLIITDVIMPDMDGFQLLASLKDLASNIPLIVISGGGRIGADRYLKVASVLGSATLIKPIDRRDLLDTVNSMLA